MNSTDEGKKTNEVEEVEAPEVIENPAESQEDYYDKFIRLLAEFDNYKKRVQRESEQIYQRVIQNTMEELLPLIDCMQLAVNVNPEEVSAEKVHEGIEALNRQLGEILGKLKVERINSLGEKFDPLLHNAILHEDNPDVGESIVVEEFATGYKIGDKVIRHSVVKVAN